MEQITIKEVAKLCGVGVSTVSRAINNHPDINPETKQKILDAIREYNYVPNNSARNLKRADSNTIAVIIKEISNSYWGVMLHVLEREVRDRKYCLVLQNVADDEDEVELALQLEKEKKVKGIIFLGGMFNYDELRLRMLRVPYVISGSGKTVPEDTGTYPKSALVTTDTEIESQSMVDYLCSCGHKRIAFITSGDEGLGRCHLNGYKRSLEKNGLEYDEKLIIRLKPGKRIYTIENGYNCTCELLKSGVDFSCIYAISDTLAVGACRAIIDSGKRVPEDYCVAGADGQDIAEYYHPSITTLKYPRVETALQSVRTLFDLIDRKKVVKRQILSGTLIERESTRKLEGVFVAIHYIEKESVKIFEKDYHALRSAQIFLQIFLFSYFLDGFL